jgi:plasmid stabilization system protein ParE
VALKIEWSLESLENLSRIFKHLEKKWTEKEITNFSQRLEEQLYIISNKPNTYKKSSKLLGTRECVLSKHNSLMYVFNEHTLFVVTVYDNRQDPEKLKS